MYSPSEVEEFRKRLRKKLRYCDITFDVRRFSDGSLMTYEAADHPWIIIDNYISEFGFTGLSTDWIQISLEQGERHLNGILQFSLMYGSHEILPETEATAFRTDFFQFFESVPRVFTNGFLYRAYSHVNEKVSGKRSPFYSRPLGWSPISKSTFDTGLVAMSNETLGILWIEEED